MISFEALTGQQEQLIVDVDGLACRLHRAVVEPFQRFVNDANSNGFNVSVASGYRSYARQCQIWNDKALGKRPVLGNDGRAIEINALTEWELAQAILRWSALPGASRHHWGTEVDIYDKGAMPADYQLQLSVDECEAGGVFEQFYQWLNAYLCEPSSGFFRPYQVDRGGVACEPWHLSFLPVASAFQQQQTIDVVRRVVSNSDMLLKDAILENLDEVFQRFVVVSTAEV